MSQSTPFPGMSPSGKDGFFSVSKVSDYFRSNQRWSALCDSLKPAKKEIPQELVEKTKAWLGEDGIKFFREVKEKHGQINACWNEGGIPHPVHFREGMQVRNFMRGSEMCADWTDHDFDDNWIDLIEKAIAGA